MSVQPLVSPELFGGGPVAVLDGAEGAVLMGPLNSGKTSAVDLARAQLDAAGIAYEELAVTDDFGVQRVKFTVERPEADDK
ncbi:hypothetical protein OG897_39405 [Streptomyces sp. NBC_00237]|uniref:hypothetical protein n=1 Tax=Streptomyces sp. NBC_00237 TaxID=2975687 RepID=UPI002257722E|nr:hypothetical protein [Streptomyces sp. NBC_00237]MCX5207457.1 hypothetical protein [Streptomyces sp. NBC_00237]